MTTLKISSEDFTAWKGTADTGLHSLEKIGGPPSGDYGAAATVMEGEHGTWSIRMAGTHQEVALLKEAVNTVETNMKAADEQGGRK